MDARSDERNGPPEDQFCDIVMKGGITSGVVYPKAIARLAGQYRFRSIGGTSAGAIAAALTAAAEYRRRNGGGLEGFRILAELPRELATPSDGDPSKSTLLSLFQPQPRTRRLFSVLVRSLNAGGTGQRWLAISKGLLVAYRYAIGSGSLIALALVGWLVLGRCAAGDHCGAAEQWPVIAVAAVLAGGLGMLAGLLVGLARDITTGFVPNGMGLCNGGPSRPGAVDAAPPLTAWLHEKIQEIAGLPPDRPLTFGQLWEAKGFPPEDWPAVDKRGMTRAGKDRRSIDLQIFTTSLAHGRPFLFPIDDESSRLFFLPADLQGYFPPAVMQRLKKGAKSYEPARDKAGELIDPPASSVPTGLRELSCKDLPIIVAARLSLSFPMLISAVPLWSVDYVPKRSERTMRRGWFSDGGIASNFPIHLFDSAIPRWPTFGLTLESMRPAYPDPVWLPDFHTQGRADQWKGVDHDADPWKQFGGFIAGIVTAAQNWKDTTASRMPGVRDRIVRIRLDDSEGGMNLDMPAQTVERVAGYGDKAADALLDKFAPGADGRTKPGWDEHRWVRFNVLVHGLMERSEGLHVAARHTPHAMSLARQIGRAVYKTPLRGDDALTPSQATALMDCLKAMERFESAFDEVRGVRQSYDPVPEPVLRFRPPL
ncbi:MAG: patatin-like phospholipase family protein [Burkholderiaceae bacterium]